jgi:hypothetical protein
MVTVVSPAVPIPGAEQLPAPTEREALAIDERRAKAAALRERGEDPYPHDYPGRTLVADLQAAQDPRALGAGERPNLGYRIAGRAIARRGHGKTLFMDLRDVRDSSRSRSTACGCSPRRCARPRQSITAWRTSRRATAAVSLT